MSGSGEQQALVITAHAAMQRQEGRAVAVIGVLDGAEARLRAENMGGLRRANEAGIRRHTFRHDGISNSG